MTNPTARGAIRTRYYGPTNTKGSRFIATNGKNRVTMAYDYALNTTENHAAAAQAFLKRHNCFESRLVKDALCFDNDYFWTWDITGPRKEAA
tara:strand:- start:215 stop:490 length:276 start_codon:yes stop_codon:yes gene_type:complete